MRRAPPRRVDRRPRTGHAHADAPVMAATGQQLRALVRHPSLSRHGRHLALDCRALPVHADHHHVPSIFRCRIGIDWRHSAARHRRGWV